MSPISSRFSLFAHPPRWLAAALVTVALLPGLALPFVRPTSAKAASNPFGQVIDLTNAERQRAGLAPLFYNPQLAQAAQGYASVLAGGSCWAHTCGPVPDFSQRIVNAGYSGWTALGENIAGGQPTPESVVAAWMASPGHRANILNPAFTEIGVGSAIGGTYGIYWSQEFGARRGFVPPPAAPVDAATAINAADDAAPADDTAYGERRDLFGAAPDTAGVAPAGTPSTAAPTTDELQQMVLDLVNDARAQEGLGPLTLDPQISDVALGHATDMMTSGVVSHAGSDGSLPMDRLRRASVRYVWTGENIWTYWGRDPRNGPATMHAAMMAEPHEAGNWNHIANILEPRFHRIGIGIVVSPEGVQYLSEDFAD